MKRLFADTFFFFAYLNADDAAHEGAAHYLNSFDGRLITTEWVLTELADGMAGIGDRETFADFHETLRSDPSVTIIPSSPDLFGEGLALYAAGSRGESRCAKFAKSIWTMTARIYTDHCECSTTRTTDFGL
jgi:hypothetical protein